jgi:hypothetical protein
MTIDIGYIQNSCVTNTIILDNEVIGTSGDNNNLAFGYKVTDIPPDVGFYFYSCAIDCGFIIDDANTAQTPEIGFGTAEASGSFSTLSAAGATTENLIQGTAVSALDGTNLYGLYIPTAGGPLAADKNAITGLWLNVAGAWADMSSGKEITATGIIYFNYVYFPEN